MNRPETFFDRLAGSSGAVFAVAQWLHAKGRIVEIPPLAKTRVDDGDLFMISRKRIEVKHRQVWFTCADDFPFPDVFVSNVAAVERAGDSVAAYVTVSADLNYAAWIYQSTRPHWLVTSCIAGNTGNVERYYTCPKEHVRFEPLTERKDDGNYFEKP